MLFIRQSAAANSGGRGDKIRSRKRTATAPAIYEIESVSNSKERGALEKIQGMFF